MAPGKAPAPGRQGDRDGRRLCLRPLQVHREDTHPGEGDAGPPAYRTLQIFGIYVLRSGLLAAIDVLHVAGALPRGPLYQGTSSHRRYRLVVTGYRPSCHSGVLCEPAPVDLLQLQGWQSRQRGNTMGTPSAMGCGTPESIYPPSVPV